MALCRAVEHNNLTWPTASTSGNLFNLIHHSIEQRHALKSLTDISSLHLSGVAALDTRDCGGRAAAADMAGTNALIRSVMAVSLFADLCPALGDAACLGRPRGILM